MSILTFDVGGSAVKYGVWHQNALTATAKFKTPLTLEAFYVEIERIKAELSQEFNFTGVGFSFPGAVDRQKGVINGISAVPYIHHFKIQKELEHRLNLPVAMENDANCAALAEVWQGVAKGSKNVLFVVLGTGVGGAVISDGKLQSGSHLYGGEFGLMLIDGEHTFSELGTAVKMAERYAKRTHQAPESFSGETVFELAEAENDPIAKEEVDKFYQFVTMGLYNLQFTTDPEKIILGGGVSAKKGLIPEINRRMSEILAKRGLNDFKPEIVVCQYKNDANLIGAAANFQAMQEN